MPEFRCTYRLQLNADFGFRAAREIVAPVRARPRRLAPLSLAVAAGARGLDARLRRRRPDARSPTSSAARTSSARSATRRTRRARRRSSTSSRTTWRPPSGEPVLARPGAARAVLRLGPRDRLVPALLRRRRARRRARRGSARSSRRRTRRCSSSSATGSSTGCASTIPTGSRTRASTSSGCASAASRTSGSRRSSSRASGCATGRSRGRRATSSRTTSTALFVDPRGEEPMTELYAELTGERRTFAEVAHEAKLEVAQHDVRAGVRAAARARTARPRLEEAAAALHVYRTYVEPETGHVEEADRRALRCCPTSCAGRPPRGRALAAARRVRRALAADDRAR